MSQVWQSVTGREPGEMMRAHCDKVKRDHEKNMKRKGKNEYREAKEKSKVTFLAWFMLSQCFIIRPPL